MLLKSQHRAAPKRALDLDACGIWTMNRGQSTLVVYSNPLGIRATGTTFHPEKRPKHPLKCMPFDILCFWPKSLLSRLLAIRHWRHCCSVQLTSVLQAIYQTMQTKGVSAHIQFTKRSLLPSWLEPRLSERPLHRLIVLSIDLKNSNFIDNEALAVCTRTGMDAAPEHDVNAPFE